LTGSDAVDSEIWARPADDVAFHAIGSVPVAGRAGVRTNATHTRTEERIVRPPCI
jgi:hypothetical protein